LFSFRISKNLLFNLILKNISIDFKRNNSKNKFISNKLL